MQKGRGPKKSPTPPYNSSKKINNNKQVLFPFFLRTFIFFCYVYFCMHMICSKYVSTKFQNLILNHLSIYFQVFFKYKKSINATLYLWYDTLFLSMTLFFENTPFFQDVSSSPSSPPQPFNEDDFLVYIVSQYVVPSPVIVSPLHFLVLARCTPSLHQCKW